MRLLHLLLRNLFHHRRTHLALILGSALTTAILLGALMTGDAVRASLQQLVYRRLGGTTHALEGPIVTEELANKLKQKLGADCVPALHLKGIAVKGGGQLRVNNINVLGVDVRFALLDPAADWAAGLSEDEAVLNAKLAARLAVVPGDQLLLKVEAPRLLPYDMPLLRDEARTISFRLTIKAITAEDELGDLNLRSHQTLPLNLFLPLAQLQREGELEGRVNRLFYTGREAAAPARLEEALATSLTLADFGLKLSATAGGAALTAESVFINEDIGKAAANTPYTGEEIFSYFVNSFRCGSRQTPYSFISALEEPFPGLRTGYNDIIINQWLADDLEAAPGDTITISYYRQGPGETLVEQQADFTLKAIVPTSAAANEASLIPAFPGLVEAENCRDWEPGIPVDLNKIRDKDEEYWDDYHAAPKAFINLARGQELWENRFGQLTAIRFRGLPEPLPSALEASLIANLEASRQGILFRPVLAQGLDAGARAIDFGGLFLGLSFFIILAALLFTSLLFLFDVEARSGELGLLLATGFRRQGISLLILTEGLCLALAGSLAGVLPGLAYNRLILAGLMSIWSGAVGTTDLIFRLQPLTLILSLAGGTLLGAGTMWLGTRKILNRPAAELLASRGQQEGRAPLKPATFSFLAGILCLAGLMTLGLLALGLNTGHQASFFSGAGALALAGELFFCHAFLRRAGMHKPSGDLRLRQLGFRNLTRKPKRTLLAIGLLASGIFIILAVGANRKALPADPAEPASGTGGYTYFGRTSLPLPGNLNQAEGRREFRLDETLFSQVEFLLIRVHEGEDASCLNLNYVEQPQILGINPLDLDSRGAFSFTALADGIDPQHPWLSLGRSPAADIIYGFADQSVLTWGLGKSLGDTLTYQDERGQEFKIQLMGGLENSIFQGNILIADSDFLARYPGVNGYDMFLAATVPALTAAVGEALEARLQNRGLDLQLALGRLGEFNKVENTYLLIFLMLGGLGLLIGMAGLAVVVLRKIMEARPELALLRTLGYAKNEILTLVLAENWLLLGLGLGGGLLAAALSLVPGYIQGTLQLSPLLLAVGVGGLLCNGLFWIFLITRLALRETPLKVLNEE